MTGKNRVTKTNFTAEGERTASKTTEIGDGEALNYSVDGRLNVKF